FECKDGRLEFEDRSAKFGFAQPQKLSVQWFRFDNATGNKSPLASEAGFTIPTDQAEYLAAEIRGSEPKKSVTVYLRREAAARRVVGIERFW
ncbi:MAG TPA: hypothetical protein VLE22_19310, partial [Bryobacteraceae bacterium]|nr:hypothetical protein [Bryobacteraceae bacterium]